MKLNIYHVACLIAIFQAFIMTFYLITDKRNKKLSKNILAVWLFVFAIILICNLLVSYKMWQYFVDYHKVIFIISQLSFLLGPLFYFYMISLFNEKFVFKPRYIIHILPFVLISIYAIITFLSVPHFVLWGTFLVFFSDCCYLFQNLIYLVLTLRILRFNGLFLKSFFNYVDNIQMVWIRLLVGGNIVLWIAKLQSLFFWIYFRDGSWCTYTATTYFMAAFIFFNTIIFFALKKPDFFSKSKKYESSSILEVDLNFIKDQLVKHMEISKPYLDMSLNLTELAKQLSIPTRTLSRVINESFQKNFYDLINSYRLEECKRLLKDPLYDKKNILEIAYESGFNTKATFNLVFKKYTGVTPTQYRKKNLQATLLKIN